MMLGMADVTERMLRLLATLQSGRVFSGSELAARMEVSPRTLRRDVERLRGYGYQVDTRPGPGGSYQLAVGKRMPPLVLDDDEAVATVVGLVSLAATRAAKPGGLNEAADRAYGKIEGFLPTRLRPRVVALRSSIEVEDRDVPDVPTGMLVELAEAVAADEVVRFHYRDVDGVSSRRIAEAHRQVHLDRHWYLFAWDLDRSDWRVFRTDRINDLRRSANHYMPRALPAESSVAYLRSGWGESYELAHVTVDAPLPAVAAAFRHHDVELHIDAQGKTQVTLALESWQRLLGPLSYLDAEFVIQATDSASSAMQRFARRLDAGIDHPEA